MNGEVENAARAFLKVKKAYQVAHRKFAAARKAYEEQKALQDAAAETLKKALGFEHKMSSATETEYLMVDDTMLKVVSNLAGAGAVYQVEYQRT